MTKTEVDDRPRKKKRKPSKAPLIIGLCVGGAVLLILGIAGTIAIIYAMSERANAQAKGKVEVPPPPLPPLQPPPDAPPKDIGEKKRDHTNIRLRIERTARINELGQIKLFYVAYGDGTRPPQTVDDFVKSIAREAPEIKKAIDDKYYVILPNVRSGVIAYERDPDTNNMHGFVDTTGGAREMSTTDLLAALKAQGN